jgi:hypothetical protein
MPAQSIEGLHGTPHLSPSFTLISNDFGITADSHWNEYTKSVLIFPAIVAAVLTAAVVAFQLTLWCKADVFDGRRDQELIFDTQRRMTARVNKTSMSVVFVFLSGTLLSFFFIEKGMAIIFDALNFMEDTFSGLSEDGDNLLVSGNNIFTKASSSTCPYSSDLIAYIPAYTSAVNEYLAYVDPVVSPISDANDEVHHWSRLRMIVLWLMFVLSLTATGLILSGAHKRSKFTVSIGFMLGKSFLSTLIMVNCLCFILLVR